MSLSLDVPDWQHPDHTELGPECTPRKVLMSPELMVQWASRDSEGNRLTVAWGKPDAYGFYEPVFTIHSDDNVVAAERARIAAAVRKVEGHPHAEQSGGSRYWISRAAVLAIVEGEG